MEWEVETYMRLLSLIGGFGQGEELERARLLFRGFNHFFPEAKAKWDAYCAERGVA